MTSELVTEISGGIARMIINRPEVRNALSGNIIQEMIVFARKVETDPKVRVLLISGEGPHFMAGGDVKGMSAVLSLPKDMARADFEQRSLDASPLWITLNQMPQPVVCKVRGYAAGAALSFVAGADITVAASNAKFLLAHVGIGLVADAATSFHLPRAIGIRKAKELAYFGQTIDAQAALEMGLVSRVTSEDQLDDTVEVLLQQLAAAPSISIRNAKRLMNASLSNTIEQQLLCEGAAVGECGASDDVAEGLAAFLEKRKPAFVGK